MLDPQVRDAHADADGRGALLKRPDPPVTIRERAVAWWRWFGPARLVATAVSVIVVGVLGFWLVRAPVPAAEATLPVAGASSLPTATLPPPTGDAPSPSTVPAVSTGSTEPGWIVVHVAGAVVDPGVYELPLGARVGEAIGSAGGASVDADLDVVNLAQVVADGQRLFVPVAGSVDHSTMPVLTPPAGGGAGSLATATDASTPAAPVDLNRASAAELERLPGVGPATAAAIVDDRTRNGPFVTVDDLERVPGVGPAKLAALRELVTV